MITGPGPFANGQLSAETEVSIQRDGGDRIASLYIIEVTDEGSWSGGIIIAARPLGAGQGGALDYPFNLGITDREDGSAIAGDTGITAPGLYEVNVAGLEFVLEHTRSAGEVRVREQIVNG